MARATVASGRSSGPRIDVLDVLRGFAVCGMLLINIPMMGRSIWDVFSNPYDGWSATEQTVYWVKEMFFEGSSRAMFSILFGASFMLMMAKTMQPGDSVAPVDIYYRRCVWMMVLGVVHATLLLWPGDILFHYALPAMALFAFRHASPKLLIGIVAVFMVVLNFMEGAEDLKHAKTYTAAQPVLAKQLAGQELTDAEEEIIEKFEEARDSKSKTTDGYEDEVKARQGYISSVRFLSGIWVQWFDFDAFSWSLEAFTFMLLGIAFYKLGILTGARSLNFYLLLGVASFTIGFLINWHETSLKFATNDAPGLWQDELTYQHGRLGIALGNICLIAAIVKSAFGRALLTPLQHIGRMALSNYLGQSIIAAILFTGFGLYGKLDNLGLWGLAAAIWVFQAIFSKVWLTYYLMGPFEWVWRSLTYWKPQPMLRERDAVSAS